MTAQPLTGWLLHSMGIWADKRTLSDRVLKIFKVSAKTWEVGIPRRPKKRQQVCDGLVAYARQSHTELMPECAERQARAMERAARALTEYPTLPPCSFFHQTVGIAGGDRLEALAVALDEVSADVVHGRLSRDGLSVAVVKAAAEVVGQPAGAMQPNSRLDPGLDALLLLLAQMDHDLTTSLMANAGEINSLVALLIDSPGSGARKRVQHRLLDIYFALALAAVGRELPESLPKVREIEDALMGGPPESGGQSWVVRWRNGTKALREEDVLSVIAHVGQVSGKDVSWTMRRLYAAAQPWGRVEEQGVEAVMLAGERYNQWWNALCNQGRVKTPWVQPYWSQFSQSK
ncbi:TPA: hypothetical protein ACOEOG_001074 [Stenotrophomonas maltophilia]